MRLDGNAAGGILTEVFAMDVTAAQCTCNHCGATGEVAATEAYMRGPGLVLRCPYCEAVLLRVVRIRERLLLDMSGIRTLKM